MRESQSTRFARPFQVKSTSKKHFFFKRRPFHSTGEKCIKVKGTGQRKDIFSSFAVKTLAVFSTKNYMSVYASARALSHMHTVVGHCILSVAKDAISILCNELMARRGEG